MSDHKFTVGTFRTSDGREACVEADKRTWGLWRDDDYPLLGWVRFKNGDKIGAKWSADGALSIGLTNGIDLLPPEPEFRITGPGRYVQRDGGIATVERRDYDGRSAYPWKGLDAERECSRWMDDGRWQRYGISPHLDLIARAPEPEMVPLEMDDIPQGAEFRTPLGTRVIPSVIMSDSIVLDGETIFYMDLSRSLWKMRAHAGDWQRCEKEGKSHE